MFPTIPGTRSPYHFFTFTGGATRFSLSFRPGPPGEKLEARVRSTKANSPRRKPASLTPTTLRTTPTTTSQRPMATTPARPPNTIVQKSALVRAPSSPVCCLTPSRCEGGRWRRGTAFGVLPSRPRPSENSYSRPRSPTTPKNWRVWTW